MTLPTEPKCMKCLHYFKRSHLAALFTNESGAHSIFSALFANHRHSIYRCPRCRTDSMVVSNRGRYLIKFCWLNSRHPTPGPDYEVCKLLEDDAEPAPGIEAASGADLDHLASATFGLTRGYSEDDGAFRDRIRKGLQ